ncbi:restriction endonuclease [Acidithiobacillus thiooxidans]|uniref:Restriction endonuclease type IV Mrr domain-containing protein n=1 Tax=Acidithiobacillus thiooxidans TaxID=930 RepID=A0A1C2J7Z6_ACITH|nr:restriction endonuclease [Acidithiobacillus thiooxidans]OCX68673.1 hypothetical protein A6M23_17410 [Acidithiobacillus thiooxidans]OCX84349.1 hypothetical protein A6P08_09235 [Acidithiobacillus thiooxidans]
MNENERWPKAIRVPEKIETKTPQKNTPPDNANIDKLKKTINFYDLWFFIFIVIMVSSFTLINYVVTDFEKELCSAFVLIGVFGSLVTWINGNELKRKIKRQQLLRAGANNVSSLTPIQFEKYCGILLNDNGWRVEYTAITGDYGADIIATKNGVRMVVQCKHYTGNVGVSAVQEVFSAMSYYHANKSCVVASRGGFTKAAQSLAVRTGVKVIGPSDLK